MTPEQAIKHFSSIDVKIMNEIKPIIRGTAVRTKKEIVSRFYSGAPRLYKRSGDAAKSWGYSFTSDANVVEAKVYSEGVKYVDYSERRIITPKRAKWLTIPVNSAVTNKGVTKFSAREASSKFTMKPGSSGDPLFFLKSKNKPNTAMLILKQNASGQGLPFGKSGNRVVFVLKKKVEIPAYNKPMDGWVTSKFDQAIRMFK